MNQQAEDIKTMPEAKDTDTKEFNFDWSKHFGRLILKSLKTKLLLDKNTLSIEINIYHLGIFKGTPFIANLPIENISEITMGAKINGWDIIYAIIFTFLGFWEPMFFIATAVCLWIGMCTKILIKTKVNSLLEIPVNSKRDAEQFLAAFNEQPIHNN